VRDESFFTRPIAGWQRRYEALRASFVERLPAATVGRRFGFTAGYVRLLRHEFRHGTLDFAEPAPEGKAARRRVSAEARRKIVAWRKERLSAGDIAQLLCEDGVDLSVRTVERVLAEEGFPKLPRRTRLKMGLTVNGAAVPERAEALCPASLEGRRLESAGAGVYLFAPFLAEFGIEQVVQAAKLPHSKMIPALSYVLSFLALKLLGTERYAHAGDHGFDPGLGLFAALTTLPKCTALSTYSYSLDEVHLSRLQRAFVERGRRLGLYDGSVINLDFHTAPHYGDVSVLEEHWAGARGKRIKGALTLFAQDAPSKLILYTAADIRRSEADSEVLDFLSFWKPLRRGVTPTLVFDSRFTTYEHLAELLTHRGIVFITLRRRGRALLAAAEDLEPWRRIHIPHAKRKYPNPLVHDSTVSLRGYEGKLRQIVVKGNGHEKPAFLITNDFETPAELIVGNYARRWRVENGIAEAVKFFHLNALPSPILTKVHFDIIMTMIADTLYTRLAHNLRGFEACDAPTLYHHFVRGKGELSLHHGDITVTYPRHAHNPILRAAPWHRLPNQLPWLNGAKLTLRFL
jgi:transposase